MSGVQLKWPTRALILLIFIQELTTAILETPETFCCWFQPASYWSREHIVKMVSPFLFEFFSIHLPCSWSQLTRPYMFHFLKITSRISPDESTCRHVQALAVFLCKQNSNALVPSAVLQSNSGFLLRVYKWRWVAFDLTLGFAFLWSWTTLIEVRIVCATSTFVECVFVWNVTVINIVIVINVSFVIDVASALDKK